MGFGEGTIMAANANIQRRLDAEIKLLRAAVSAANDLDTDGSRSTDDCLEDWRAEHAEAIATASQ